MAFNTSLTCSSASAFTSLLDAASSSATTPACMYICVYVRIYVCMYAHINTYVCSHGIQHQFDLLVGKRFHVTAGCCLLFRYYTSLYVCVCVLHVNTYACFLSQYFAACKMIQVCIYACMHACTYKHGFHVTAGRCFLFCEMIQVCMHACVCFKPIFCSIPVK
jgi:hypothetical protein